MSDAKFLPGSTIGVMGGGQLGRMFAIAARRMGYIVQVFTPGRRDARRTIRRPDSHRGL